MFWENSKRIQSTFFAKYSILDASLGSEHVSDYPEALSIIINWGFHSESFKNFPDLVSIFLKNLEPNIRVRCNNVMFETCQRHHEERERFLLSCSCFFIDNLEHVYNWIGCFYLAMIKQKQLWKIMWMWNQCNQCTCYDNVTKNKKHKVCLTNYCLRLDIFISWNTLNIYLHIK